jgi:hypothetical protein
MANSAIGSALAVLEVKRALRAGTPGEIIWGVVVSLQTAPNSLTISLGASTVAVPGFRYLASYTPTIADVVAIILVGDDPFVLGQRA